LHIVDLPRYFPIEFECFFQAGTLLKDLAGTLLIRPEIGFADYALQLVKLMLPGTSVKETSALPRCESLPG
jgi:hypothetical protein